MEFLNWLTSNLLLFLTTFYALFWEVHALVDVAYRAGSFTTIPLLSWVIWFFLNLCLLSVCVLFFTTTILVLIDLLFLPKKIYNKLFNI